MLALKTFLITDPYP